MIIYEPRQIVYVSTPKGKGHIWLVTEYGMETPKLFTVITNDNEVWMFTNDQVLVDGNPTITNKWRKDGDKTTN